MQVIWSPDAEKELDHIVEYCLITFGKRTATKVYQQIKHYDELLAQNPLMGKHETLLENIHKASAALWNIIITSSFIISTNKRI